MKRTSCTSRSNATLALLLSLTACSAGQVVLPVKIHIPASPTHATFVLMGDTGTFDDDSDAACEPEARSKKLSASCRNDMLASVRDEHPNAVIILGDLVYELGPLCPRGELSAAAEKTLDRVVGRIAEEVKAPVVLVLGNHDVWHSPAGLLEAETCYREYAQRFSREKGWIVFPERNFVVDVGPATLVGLDTTRPGRPELMTELHSALSRDEGRWLLMAAHHPWHTYGDKRGTRHHKGKGWSDQIGIVPHFWLNGHAHLLQFGEYDAAVGQEGRTVAAVTSGAAGKLRSKKRQLAIECGPYEGEMRCDPENDGLQFARSTYGYAVLRLTGNNARLVFKRVDGEPLFVWERNLDEPMGIHLPLSTSTTSAP